VRFRLPDDLLAVVDRFAREHVHVDTAEDPAPEGEPDAPDSEARPGI
jgi:hypothetical protein